MHCWILVDNVDRKLMDSLTSWTHYSSVKDLFGIVEKLQNILQSSHKNKISSATLFQWFITICRCSLDAPMEAHANVDGKDIATNSTCKSIKRTPCGTSTLKMRESIQYAFNPNSNSYLD